ncbi:hypothetical protein [Streptomyces sp. NPDC050428]|uniref:hypothetical protein n=1 Tax=Streptomyces sp. NPDC050428 TaxID=3155757 RepID=UPI0034265AA5
MKRLNNRGNNKRVYLLGPATVTAVLGLTLSACTDSEPEREYKIPSALCGTPVSPTLLEPALPPGKEITISTKPLITRKRCIVSVDGNQVFSVITSWRSEGTTVTEVAAGQPFVKLDNVVTKDGRYAYSDRGAVGKVHCANPSMEFRKESQLFVQFLTNVKAKESETKDLITGLAKAVAESDECTHKNN